MCYSTTTSLFTFTIMAISTIFLIYRNYPNDRWFAVQFGSFTGGMEAGSDVVETVASAASAAQEMFVGKPEF